MENLSCTIRALHKSFGPNHVLNNIDLDLPKGQISVLMGANGAGKSTLVKVLCGVHAADSGTMHLFGDAYHPVSPADAFKKGVVTVHQSIDDGVTPDLDVASNLLLDRLSSGEIGFFLKPKQMHAMAQEIAASIGLDVDIKAIVADLGIADRQMVAIARAMTHAPKLLILDEPTSSLSAAEADRLFQFLDNLRQTGVAILYISHRMSDIRRLADRIITMRDGQISARFEKKHLDFEAAITAMLGQKLRTVDITRRQKGASVLTLTDVKLAPDSPKLNLKIHANEVVAITGLLGSGKSALAATLFGLGKPAAGEIILAGQPYAPKSPADAIKSGVFLCPKDRFSNGVISAFDIADNMVLPFSNRFSKWTFLQPKKIAKMVDQMISALGIVCQDWSDNILTLSGGNQQKVMVARWLAQPSNVIILDEPFQGVDIQARRDIGAFIRANSNGRATVILTGEIDEALEVADRIVVMHERAIVGQHDNTDLDLSKLLSQYSGEMV